MKEREEKKKNSKKKREKKIIEKCVRTLKEEEKIK